MAYKGQGNWFEHASTAKVIYKYHTLKIKPKLKNYT
jgi:hypothetical protein